MRGPQHAPKTRPKTTLTKKEFLSYVDGFDEGIINNDPTDLFPMTNSKRQDEISLQADTRQAKESNKGHSKAVEKEIQLHIEENEDFIIETITFFTPARETGHESEDHCVLDLQEELKLLELELIPPKTGNRVKPCSPGSPYTLIHLITDYHEKPYNPERFLPKGKQNKESNAAKRMPNPWSGQNN